MVREHGIDGYGHFRGERAPHPPSSIQIPPRPSFQQKPRPILDSDKLHLAVVLAVLRQPMDFFRAPRDHFLKRGLVQLDTLGLSFEVAE